MSFLLYGHLADDAAVGEKFNDVIDYSWRVIYEHDKEKWAKHTSLGHSTGYWSPVRVAFADTLLSSIQVASQPTPYLVTEAKPFQFVV